MICSEASGLLASAADGELDAAQERAMHLHVAGCAACAAELDALTALGRDLRAQAPYHEAPASLRARIAAEVASSGGGEAAMPRRAVMPSRWRWLTAGALGGALATLAIIAVVTAALGIRARADFASEAVASHVRATLGNHLVEVVSSDRHTVKPWLSARLDYAPPVEDLRDEGFPLVGARIDYLDGSPVATLVYRYRAHVIDVFVRPRVAGAGAPALRTVRGFTVVGADGAQMAWRAVADVQGDVLAAFVARLAKDDSASAAATP